MPELGQLGAGQDEQVLGDGQVVDVHHPQLGVVVAQVEDGGDIACVAVSNGTTPWRCRPADGIEHLVPRRAADGSAWGKSARSAMWAKAPSTP